MIHAFSIVLLTSKVEHDVVLLRSRGDKKPKWRLTPSLRSDQRVKLPYGGQISAEEIIGKRYLDAIKDSKGREVIIHEASLGSYIVNSERMATPIYPQDAGTIVSMMDLHPERPGEVDGEEEVFEVFEAGTGMGSLTLHIARALHAANPALSVEVRNAVAGAEIKRRMPRERPNDEVATEIESDVGAPAASESDISIAETYETEDPNIIKTLALDRLDVSPAISSQLEAYAFSRRAILHTLDRNPKHVREAYKLIRRFRRGMYLPTIDFHIGTILNYLALRLEASANKPFLSRAVLDLPGADEVAGIVVKALKPNGLLIVFNPSISQIGEFAAWAAKEKEPLRLERVAELPNTVNVATDDPGVNDIGGGRPWDVRTVVTRGEDGGDVVQVMRPKVGDRVAGGGFVAVFRRLPERLVEVREKMAVEAEEEAKSDEEVKTEKEDSSDHEVESNS